MTRHCKIFGRLNLVIELSVKFGFHWAISIKICVMLWYVMLKIINW